MKYWIQSTNAVRLLGYPLLFLYCFASQLSGVSASVHLEKPPAVPVKPLVVSAFERSMFPKIEIQEDNILFEINTTDLIDSSYVNAFLESVKKEVGDRAINVTIEGHTCDLGTDAYNKKLGEKRAYSMMDFFVLEGLNINVLEVMSLGEALPKVENSSEPNRQKNRRVAISIESVTAESVSEQVWPEDQLPHDMAICSSFSPGQEDFRMVFQQFSFRRVVSFSRKKQPSQKFERHLFAEYVFWATFHGEYDKEHSMVFPPT